MIFLEVKMNKEDYEELKKILLSHGVLEEDIDAIIEFVKNGGSNEFLNKDQ